MARRDDAAFNAKDMDKLATFYHPEVTIREGGGVNDGWIEVSRPSPRARTHIVRESAVCTRNIQVTVLPGGQSAYATSEYPIKAKMGDRQIDSRGIETPVLLKGSDGNWKIRHSHTSSRPARSHAA